MKMNVMTGTYFKGEETHNFDFYTKLSAATKLKFVDSVVSVLVNDKHYNSIIKDIIFDFYIIDIFSSVNTTELKESLTFLKDVEEFLEETNIVEIIKANVEIGLIDELRNAVDNSIAYLTGIHPNPLTEALASLLSTLEKKISEVDLSNMAEMAQKFADMTDELTSESIMNAYMNSDIHKKNLDEIAEVNKRKMEFAEDLDKAIKAVTNN